MLALVAACLAMPTVAAAQEFRIEEVPASGNVTALKPKTIAFTDYRNDELADAGTGLMRFEDWAKARPIQKQLLSLYPAYVEPTISITVHGVTKPYKEKLHIYVAEARFVVARPPASIDLARYVSATFLERVDGTIKHRLITPSEAMPYTDAETAHNRHPQRRWCEGGGPAICIESRYQLEGKLPIGIRLANKLEDSGKKIADHITFQSELRLLPPQEIDQASLAKLTGVATPVRGVLEQSIFYVNQMMQFGRFVGVFQQHPSDPDRTLVSAFMALGIETDVLEKKKEYEKVPILRNLVPAQVLVGKSSFNTGQSISAGLPDYTRNRVKAIAALLERE
ncbi:MAG TPA: hypothetical protein VHN20_00100 [Beijerinckiaceae bacterium]|nr:hypothetical protein [Beijerinckiaceae bacterium]